MLWYGKNVFNAELILDLLILFSFSESFFFKWLFKDSLIILDVKFLSNKLYTHFDVKYDVILIFKSSYLKSL